MTPLHKRLIGTWKSDKRLTLQFCHRYHCLIGARKRRFGALFGKLEIRYTQKFVYSKLGDLEHRDPYDVVAEDSESIVIRKFPVGLKAEIQKVAGPIFDEFFEPGLQRICFRTRRSREYYWVGCGQYCEWFRKIDSKTRPSRLQRSKPPSKRSMNSSPFR